MRRFQFKILDKEKAGQPVAWWEHVAVSIEPLSIFLGPIHHTMAGMHGKGIIHIGFYGLVVLVMSDAGASPFVTFGVANLVSAGLFPRDL